MTTDAQAATFGVLVVDDEPDARRLLAEFFRTRGISVAEADSGRAAISMVQQSSERFDLVVTDLNMPGADGFAVLDAARRVDPAVDVVIVTGHASIESAVRAVRAGASDYLTKPFALSQLEAALDRIRDRRAAVSRSGIQVSSGVADYPGQSGRDALDLRLTAIEQSLVRIERALGTASR
jgi:DNA-binding NtrC family response regulator